MADPQVYQDNPPQFFPQPFKNNSINAQGYYVTITNGTTNIFRKGKNTFGQEDVVNIGSIARKGGFSNTGNASKEEIQYFTANARKTINEQAVPVVKRGIGGDAGGGYAKVNQVLGTNLAPTQQQTPPPAPTLPSPEQVAASGLLPTISQTENKTMIAVYPLKMDKEGSLQDRIKFTALEYIASGSISNLSLQSRDRTSNLEGKKPLGHVFLPVQAGIADANSVSWQDSNLNEIQRLAVNLSTDIMGASTAEDVGSKLSSALTKASDDLMKEGNAAKVALAGEAVGIQNLLGRFGATLNPNLELLFSGPTLRPFNFRFQMSAREEAEAKNILKIINFFKKNMAPRTTENNIFLKAPNTFLIEYKFKGSEQEHPGINKIKECALLNCSVDYTPLGTYMTYENGAMVSYSVTLSFQELEPIYDKDYAGKHPIGY